MRIPCRPAFLSLVAVAVLLPGTHPPARAAERPPSAWPAGTIDTWHGFKRHHFTVAGCRAWVVEPREAQPGKPWSWCLEFPDAFTERCAAPALLSNGLHHAHIAVGNTFGSPAALKQFTAFYEALTACGLARKPVLIGLSRGGLYAYRWAAENPDKVSVIYGDAPVCDFKSWPGGKGNGKGSPADWAALIECYGFTDEAGALAYPGNPIDTLAPLARAGVTLIHVVGDADDVVPVDENTAIVEERYRQLGGRMKVIHKPGVGHHPHGLDNPAPVVDFILNAIASTAAGQDHDGAAPGQPTRIIRYHGLRPTDPGGRAGLRNPERGWRIEAVIAEPPRKTFGPAHHLADRVPPVYQEDWWTLDAERYEAFGLTLVQAYNPGSPWLPSGAAKRATAGPGAAGRGILGGSRLGEPRVFDAAQPAPGLPHPDEPQESRDSSFRSDRRSAPVAAVPPRGFRT